MKLNRRSIFGLAAGAAVAPIVPALPAAAAVAEWISLTPKPPFYGNAFTSEIITNMDFSDNLEKSIRTCGKRFAEMIPEIYRLPEDEE